MFRYNSVKNTSLMMSLSIGYPDSKFMLVPQVVGIQLYTNNSVQLPLGHKAIVGLLKCLLHTISVHEMTPC